jgi:uncharacterized protein
MAPPMSDFAATIRQAYSTEGAAIDLGRGVHDGLLAGEAVVQVPLRMSNRHGLIAGATGTGKTISLQTIAEQLSRRRAPAPSSGNVGVLTDFLTSREGKSLQKKVMRGLFGMKKSL